LAGAWRRDEHRPAWAVAAAGVSLAAYGAFALTDYQLNLPVVAALVAANLAVLLRKSDPADRVIASTARIRPSLALAGCGALVVVGTIVTDLPAWVARNGFAAGVNALERGGQGEIFDARVAAAAKLEPDNPAYFAGAAAGHLRLSFSERDPAKRAVQQASAINFLRQTLQRDPQSEFAHFNLGWLLLETDPGAAAEHFRAALPLAPERGGTLFGLGLARLAQGDTDRTREAWALEVLSDPEFLAAPAWDTDMLAPHQAAVVDRATEIAAAWLARPNAPLMAELQRVHDILLPQWSSGDRAPDLPAPSVLTQALQERARRQEILNVAFLRRDGRPAAAEELRIVETLLDRLGSHWRDWLRAPEGREAPFAHFSRNERPAFAMLAGNMDIPVPVDAYVVQTNRLVHTFFGFLFPPRGYLPDTLLLKYVADRDL
jgi:tetratricopeptide (TPR) repeat protein